MAIYKIPYVFETQGIAKAFVKAESPKEAWNKFLNDDFEVPFGAEDLVVRDGDLRKVTACDAGLSWNSHTCSP